MSKELSAAVLRAGLVEPGVLAEIRRWGLPIDIGVGEELTLADTKEEALAAIRDGLESESMVEIRDTDLDIMHTYLKGQSKGRLVVRGESIPVSFCRLATGEYAIPWMSESISDLLVDGETHLKVRRKKVFFWDVREVYFGEMKAFVVCSPGKRDEEDE